MPYSTCESSAISSTGRSSTPTRRMRSSRRKQRLARFSAHRMHSNVFIFATLRASKNPSRHNERSRSVDWRSRLSSIARWCVRPIPPCGASSRNSDTRSSTEPGNRRHDHQLQIPPAAETALPIPTPGESRKKSHSVPLLRRKAAGFRTLRIRLTIRMAVEEARTTRSLWPNTPRAHNSYSQWEYRAAWRT